MVSSPFTRTDQSLFGRWWWTVDRWSLAALMLLIAIGILLIATASAPVAQRLGLAPSYFIYRHLLMLIPSLIILLGMSLLTPAQVRLLALAVLTIAVILTALTLIVGIEIKGARRWIHLPGLSLQPSEFLKPAFAVVTAWLFSLHQQRPGFPGKVISIALYIFIVFLLLMQPDVGMTIVISAVWLTQFFLAGLPFALVGLIIAISTIGLMGIYVLLPHVQSRIDRFLNPGSGDTYQIGKSLEAFTNGGLFGTGLGQGKVKMVLPDAHADFIFSVAGEELGLLFCLFLVILFAFVVLRGFMRVTLTGNLFAILAVGGLLTQFGLQVLINMGSALHLIPTKGMTLPMISYGGSSLLATSFGLGMVLALTRKRRREEPS